MSWKFDLSADPTTAEVLAHNDWALHLYYYDSGCAYDGLCWARPTAPRGWPLEGLHDCTPTRREQALEIPGWSWERAEAERSDVVLYLLRYGACWQLPKGIGCSEQRAQPKRVKGSAKFYQTTCDERPWSQHGMGFMDLTCTTDLELVASAQAALRSQRNHLARLEANLASLLERTRGAHVMRLVVYPAEVPAALFLLEQMGLVCFDNEPDPQGYNGLGGRLWTLAYQYSRAELQPLTPRNPPEA